MKINKFLMLGFAFVFLYSCDTNNEETGYDPSNYNYSQAQSFTLTSDATASTDTSFEITYTPSASGKGYYMVVPSGSAAPTSTQVHAGGGLQSGSFDLDGSTPVIITVDSPGIYGAFDYDIYAVHKSVDNFISEGVSKITVTVPDTIAPFLLRDSSSPAFTAAGINPFAPVTWNFNEPVFYQGGDIKFTGFFSGREIIVNTASALSMNGTTITADTHGTFAQDDFIIMTWEDGTFKDRSGKSVPALTGFAHYFHTREFTVPESAYLMQGTYQYETVFYGGLGGFYSANAALFLPDTGTFDLVLDPNDPTGTTLLGINVFSPLINFGYDTTPQNIPIKLGAAGELEVVTLTAGIPLSTGEATSWGPWSFFGTDFPGFYDVDGGTINQWLTLSIDATGAAVDDLDYNYTRIGTFAKSSSTLKDLKEKNNLLKSKILNGRKRILPTDTKFLKLK